jgi:hypothetical protein
VAAGQRARSEPGECCCERTGHGERERRGATKTPHREVTLTDGGLLHASS